MIGVLENSEEGGKKTIVHKMKEYYNHTVSDLTSNSELSSTIIAKYKN